MDPLGEWTNPEFEERAALPIVEFQTWALVEVQFPRPWISRSPVGKRSRFLSHVFFVKNVGTWESNMYHPKWWLGGGFKYFSIFIPTWEMILFD